jgi:hypothetical protein
MSGLYLVAKHAAWCMVTEPQSKHIAHDCTKRSVFTKQLLCLYLHLLVGRDSSVGIATDYGLDGPEIEFRWGRDFPPIHTDLGA